MLGYGDLFVNFFCAFYVRLDLFNLIQTQSILDIRDLPSIYFQIVEYRQNDF
jgi:hypothetical protein